MDARELLKTWPSWAKAGSEQILASPAWRLDVRLGDDARGVMRRLEAPEVAEAGLGADAIRLRVTFDGAETVLALADSPRYPDLHLLWAKRAALPEAVVLALVEKECGFVFALLEQLARRQFGVKGFAPEGEPAPSSAYRVEGDGDAFDFALDFDGETRARFARLENLDPTQESIRALTRPARADYTALMLTEDERQALKAGDFILLPEGFPSTQAWIVDPPPEGALHLVAAETKEITFAAFADDALPEVPPPTDLLLVAGERPLFACEGATVGIAPAVRLKPLP